MMFRHFDKVEAFYNFGWSRGIVTQVVDNGRCIVFLKHLQKEVELNCADLRLPAVRPVSEFVDSSQGDTPMSSAPKDMAANPDDDGKNSLPPENSDAATERVTGNGTVKAVEKLNVETATGQLQVSTRVPVAKTTVPEQLNQPATLEAPVSDLNENARGEQSENGDKADDRSASLEKNLGTSRDIVKSPTNNKISFSRRKGKGRGKARGIVFRSPTASPAGTGKLPEQAASELQQEERPPCSAVTDGDTVITANEGTSADAADDANSEGKGSKNKSAPPKRKRGRPFGSLSGSVIRKGNANEASGASLVIGGLRGKSTRERRAVYESAMHTLRPRPKKRKSATGVSSSAQETQRKERKKKDDDLTRNGVGESSVPVSDGAIPPIPDDDRPLSTWIGEADHSKTNADENVSQNATQPEDDAGKSEAEKVRDPAVKPLPFAKTSPIWKVIDSLDVFQKIPQNPHFEPLFEAKENFREGLAVGAMVTLSVLVEKISKFTFDDPASFLEASLETLSDLEKHGFNVEPVRDRLNALLCIKNRYDQAQAVAREIIEQSEARAKVEEQINNLDRKIQRLKDRRSIAEAERARKDAKISGLRARLNSIKDAVDGASAEFEKLANAPW